MTENKNIIKGNNRADLHVVKAHTFYATIDIKSKNKEGKTLVKTIVATHKGTRLEAKIALNQLAKSKGGTVSYFGGFKK